MAKKRQTPKAKKKPPALSPISAQEKRRLRSLEDTIQGGIHGYFWQLGVALEEVRESRLYRDECATFHDYCSKRWGMTRRHADRMIESSYAYQNLRPMGLKDSGEGDAILPVSERQIRPLLDLKQPEQQRQAWQEAVSEWESLPKKPAGQKGPPARLVNKAVDAILSRSVADAGATPEAPPDAPASSPEEETEVGGVPTDEDGTPLPPQAIAAFEGLPTLRKFCRTLDALSAELEQLGKSPVGTHVHWQSARSQLKAARSTVWQGRPSHVCPLCSGKDPDCKTCRGHGFVTAAIHDQFQPAGRNGGQTA